MEISQRLLKLRYHFVAALILCITLFTLILIAPTFITLFTYFCPLFLSTTIVLALVFIFARNSSSESSLHKTLLDYVAASHLHEDSSFLD
ncbi:hypothetical protein TanjilG_00820 [Lupinus angustifolius]|uniref:Uncharacterized protein n=1 Tax=Lupinus angustifolius TaxID=3871 RepID=A0A4P1R7Y2_LUPAN|nr:hypothetical protein TanjilG_00820 [Lupinus angustifolius]